MRTRLRTAARPVLTVLAVAVTWAALSVPTDLATVGPASLGHLPLEAVVLVLLVVALPARPARVVAVAAGALLAVVAVLELLDLAFRSALGRPFDPVLDWTYVGDLVGLVRDSFGATLGTVLLLAGVVLLLGVLILVPASLLRLARALRRHRRPAARAAAGSAALWLLLALVGAHGLAGGPVASATSAEYAYTEVSRIPAVLRDQQHFEQATLADPLRAVPADRLLTALRGKDVLFVFVESYGRVAVQGSSFSPSVDRTLDNGTRRLHASGFSARSAFLTSPTFGGLSWLAHSTLQSGLWVDSQQRYDTLVTSPRQTLSRAFGRAGWRTVSDVPADTSAWPQGAFYGYDHFYDARNVGYAGPRFGYPTMPDQFTLDALHRLELARTRRAPVMAEVDLLSSHVPWSRTPRLVPQSAVGDGSVFDGMPATLPSEADIWPSPARVQAAYGRSVVYSLNALISFVRHYGTDRTVLVVLGDHQPSSIVSGQDPGHDVPISVIAHDPAVLRRIAPWHWQAGLRPAPDAPVWRMDSFRDRFLRTFGP